jgi:hypothetical protein
MNTNTSPWQPVGGASSKLREIGDVVDRVVVLEDEDGDLRRRDGVLVDVDGDRALAREDRRTAVRVARARQD